MEYLTHTILSISQNNLIENQLIKTYIITGISIVESILWILLKGNNLNKQAEWEEIQNRETNCFKDEKKDYKFQVIHYRRLNSKIDIEMKFIDMCKRAEKTKILGINSDVYSKMHYLRKLRNRIHIHIHIHSVEDDRDNDFWIFSNKDKELMDSVLISVLRSNIFKPYPKYSDMFDWLC